MTIKRRLYYWWRRVTNRKDIINWVFDLKFPYKVGDVMYSGYSNPQLEIVYVKKLKDRTYKIKTLPIKDKIIINEGVHNETTFNK